MAEQTIHSQTLLRGEIYTEIVDITLDADDGTGTWKSKLSNPLAAVCQLQGSSSPSAETFAVNISGRTVTVYSSSGTSSSRIHVIVKGYLF